MDTCIETICRKEGLHLESLLPMNGGQTNIVYSAGPEVVLRVARNLESSRRLQIESELLREVGAALPVPHILSAGEVEGRAYQLQRRARGQNLHCIWPTLSSSAKEAIMSQLGQALETMHQKSIGGMGMLHEPEVLKPCSTWQEYCEEWLDQSLCNHAKLKDGIPASILDLVTERFKRDKRYLADSPIVLVHADLWPGNILVEGETVTAILDFEFAHAAPQDYELLLIEDFCLYPQDFMAQESGSVCAADYADFFCLLRKHTPTLFQIPHLRERLDLYHLLFNLHLYTSVRMNGWDDPSRQFWLAKLARITNVLFNHGVRMFEQAHSPISEWA